jgi:hypothetical protein
MSADYADALAQEFVDWLLEEYGPKKESLALFSLGLTPDGLAIRNTILSVLHPMLISHSGGIYSSKFPRQKLLNVARQTIDRMAIPQSTGGENV